MALGERMDQFSELMDFDLDLVGFDCVAELDWDDPPTCPFKPGCGLTVRDCPLKARLAQISRAPRRLQ